MLSASHSVLSHSRSLSLTLCSQPLTMCSQARYLTMCSQSHSLILCSRSHSRSLSLTLTLILRALSLTDDGRSHESNSTGGGIGPSGQAKLREGTYAGTSTTVLASAALDISAFHLVLPVAPSRLQKCNLCQRIQKCNPSQYIQY